MSSDRRGARVHDPDPDALASIPAIDLAVVYGVPVPDSEHELAVAAVTLRPGAELVGREVGSALRKLDVGQRPSIVQVVDRIPVTTWFRPLTRDLRAAGVPEADEDRQAWYLDASGDAYRPLTDAAHRRLVSA